jgi:hypothetical protein
MINISTYNNLPELTGIFNSYITEPLYSDNFQIVQYPKRNWWVLMNKTDDFFNENNTFQSDDNISYVTYYAYELLNKEFSSILIAGLGIGILPYIIKNNSSCSVIDVVEINQEIIDLVSPIGHLEGVNIINDDIFTYTPNINYDIILLNIWTCQCDYLESEIPTLVSKYKPYLNPSGFIYAPANANLGDTIFTN